MSKISDILKGRTDEPFTALGEASSNTAEKLVAIRKKLNKIKSAAQFKVQTTLNKKQSKARSKSKRARKARKSNR